MGIFDIFKQQKQKDLISKREEVLHNRVRITDGTIIDHNTSERGEEIVSYIYNVQGAEFESSDILTGEQLQNPLRFMPGAKVGIRFDPKNHGNSMLI
jgi:hypothetical protein